MNEPHPLGRPTVQVEVFAGGEKPIRRATGFLLYCEGRYFLATNYHVLSGRHPKTGKLQDLVPQSVLVHHRTIDHSTLYGGIRPTHEPLLDEHQAPNWICHEHRDLSASEDPQLAVDVALLPLTDTAHVVRQYTYLWESLVVEPKVAVGTEVSVVGYPLGYTGLVGYPIWKCAHIASEIHAHPDRKHFLIDCVSREGMSGAPVVKKGEGGQLLGIYSGRMFQDDDFGIGIVWRWHLLHELLEMYFKRRLYRT
jgi:hypothetical protein